jgi:hypothetical protein
MCFPNGQDWRIRLMPRSRSSFKRKGTWNKEMAERDTENMSLERQNESLPSLLGRLADELTQLFDAKLDLLKAELKEEARAYDVMRGCRKRTTLTYQVEGSRHRSLTPLEAIVRNCM